MKVRDAFTTWFGKLSGLKSVGAISSKHRNSSSISHLLMIISVWLLVCADFCLRLMAFFSHKVLYLSPFEFLML